MFKPNIQKNKTPTKRNNRQDMKGELKHPLSAFAQQIMRPRPKSSKLITKRVNSSRPFYLSTTFWGLIKTVSMIEKFVKSARCTTILPTKVKK